MDATTVDVAGTNPAARVARRLAVAAARWLYELIVVVKMELMLLTATLTYDAICSSMLFSATLVLAWTA